MYGPFCPFDLHGVVSSCPFITFSNGPRNQPGTFSSIEGKGVSVCYSSIQSTKGCSAELTDSLFLFFLLYRHTYQLIQVSIIFLVYRCVLLPISIGKLYHWIRGQAMLKLYVLIAIVEIFDRLMCSLGQDCLDSLYWNTTRRPRSTRMLISVSVVFAYTAVHSLFLLLHVATLNVAMNSADEALSKFAR